MSLPTELIESSCNQSSTYFISRANLNFPCANYTLPLSSAQKEAFDLAISNSPISLISGNPASGKTHVGCFVLEMSVRFQKSILVVARHANTLEAYKNLNVNSLFLEIFNNYSDSIFAWLRHNLAQPKINFMPLHLFPDPLLEILQESKHLNQWIDLAEKGDKKNLQEEMMRVFPQVSKSRLDLLVEKLYKLYPLLKQHQKLKEHYLNLSEEGILQLTELMSETTKIPILATFQNVLNSDVKFKQFEIVLVEDSHLFSDHDLLLMASMTDKLILLGENIKSDTFFTRLSECLSPAYRANLSENFRLRPLLSRPIFSTFYYSQPYSSLQNYSYRTFQNRLRWIDIHEDKLITPQLLDFIENSDIDIFSIKVGILTFSITAKEMIQSQCPEQSLNQIYVDSCENWYGKECNVLLIVCDGTKPTPDQLRLALTRASDAIVCFGDINQYEMSSFRTLIRDKTLTIEREVSLL